MFALIPLIFGIVSAGFWLWMILDLSKNDYLTTQQKNNWFIAFMLLNVFAALWYYLVEYRPRNR